MWDWLQKQKTIKNGWVRKIGWNGWNLVATHEIKIVLTLDKPSYVEFNIVDLRKLLIYDLYISIIDIWTI